MVATEELRSHLVNVLAVPRCGIVLDFSGNSGGNMWPMLVGLSPLLTEGVLGYFKDAHGTTKAIEKKAGGIFIGGSGHKLNGATIQQPRYPVVLVAVAVGARSASSGEIVPIMFHGQENVRMFGQRTSGYSTVNTTFRLPNGGTANITTAVTLDRHERVFEAHIQPETLAKKPVEAAARWISNQCQRENPNHQFKPTALHGAASLKSQSII
jgi:C-terminal processing protease CtpA/Prc